MSNSPTQHNTTYNPPKGSLSEDVWVTLTWRELRMGAFAGIERRIMDLYNGCSDRNGAPSGDLGWQLDIQGVLAEWAFAKHLGHYWPGADPRLYQAGDVSRFQVRSTTNRVGSLIVHPDDANDSAFVLVICVPPLSFRMAGFMAGVDAKQKRWWRDDVRTPAYFVPQIELRPVQEFV